MKATIVGAGLVGSLLSVYFARRGMAVEMYERRPDMRKEAISAGRSINLALSHRGISALKQVGLEEEVLKTAVPMRGRMIHAVDGALSFLPYGREDECIYSISRGGLNKTLMTAAESTGRVRIHFNQRATRVDLDSGRVSFKDERSGAEQSVDADILIGSDGSASALREELMKRSGHVCTQDALDYGYKELLIPPGPGGSFALEKNALHIWPRGTYMLIALPNFDGSFTCTLFLPFKGAVSFETLGAREQVAAFFHEQFKDAVPLIPGLLDEFFSNPTGHMVTVKSSPWNHQGRALLIGDAAHAIVPFFGQGMNCGFEDCEILNRMMDASGAVSLEKVFGDFSRSRKPDADSIADLAVENFIEMRDKVADPKFVLEKSIERVLMKEFPSEYVTRYQLVTFSSVPYRVAVQAGRVQDAILAELCSGISKPEAVDLRRAGELIRERLVPVLNSAMRA